jgi:hypothetical protein
MRLCKDAHARERSENTVERLFVCLRLLGKRLNGAGTCDQQIGDLQYRHRPYALLD